MKRSLYLPLFLLLAGCQASQARTVASDRDELSIKDCVTQPGGLAFGHPFVMQAPTGNADVDRKNQEKRERYDRTVARCEEIRAAMECSKREKKEWTEIVFQKSTGSERVTDRMFKNAAASLSFCSER